MIYKLTSVKRVIAKVFTDLDLQEGEHRITDMIEWAGEALEKIGAFPSFINKVTGKDGNPILEVVNYQTKLPCDFHSMIQVSFSENENGPFYPMRYGTGSFDYGKVVNETSSTDAVFPDSSLVTLAMTLYTLDYAAALAKINSEPITRSNLNGLLVSMTSQVSAGARDVNLSTTTDYTYIITSNYIKTNISAGYIMMAYQAIPTDNNGYPMIPDDVDFLEAIYWYITMKLLYPQWKQGSVRDQVYYDARRSWNYNCKKAYGNAIMPNVDQLESIKNSWNRLVPELTEWSSGFSTLGERQLIYNANN
jgi:hypothetical protein